MTCIVGIAKDGVVWLGGDSRGSCAYEYAQYTTPKVFRNGDFIIGYTTSYRMGQLLQHTFKPLGCPSDQDLYEYMTTTFVDEVRKTFEDGGFTNSNKTSGGDFLVGVAGRLFSVQDDFAVMEATRGWDAVGSGAQAALGALYNSEDWAVTSKARVGNALETAAALNSGVGAPFNFVSLGETNEY